MRISDWSSDVCSSDLEIPFDRGITAEGPLWFQGRVATRHRLQAHRIIDRHGGALIDEIRTGRAADERRPKFQPVGGIKVQVQAGEQKGAIVFHAEGCKGIANSRRADSREIGSAAVRERVWP